MVRDIARSRVGCKADVLATDQKIDRVANFCVMAVPGHLDPGISPATHDCLLLRAAKTVVDDRGNPGHGPECDN
jgi:hypothetical protein